METGSFCVRMRYWERTTRCRPLAVLHNACKHCTSGSAPYLALLAHRTTFHIGETDFSHSNKVSRETFYRRETRLTSQKLGYRRSWVAGIETTRTHYTNKNSFKRTGTRLVDTKYGDTLRVTCKTLRWADKKQRNIVRLPNCGIYRFWYASTTRRGFHFLSGFTLPAATKVQ